MSANVKKEYSNGDITVVWKPNTCIHSEKCWRGLGAVFNPKARPWIDVDGAANEAITHQVDQCPSGALTWYANKDGKPDARNLTADAKVEVTANGPVLIHGVVEVNHENGASEKREGVTALCRCGMSSNKPYCDGSHRKEGWTSS